MRKTMLAFILFNSLLTILSCSKNYTLETKDAGQYGYQVWQGYFILQNKVQIPLLFGVEEKEGIRQVRIFSGSELAHWSYWQEDVNTDSISFKSGLHSEFRGLRKNDKITGIYLDGVNTKIERAKFVAEKVTTQHSPFPQVTNPTNIALTGTWELDFGLLKDLSNPKELLRYNIDRVQTFDLYSNGSTLLGKAYGAGGIQGLEGKLTENGFICSSFHHSEPFLIEATFTDENTFNAIITSTTDLYKVNARRKSQVKEDSEHTRSLITGIAHTLKAYFNW